MDTTSPQGDILRAKGGARTLLASASVDKHPFHNAYTPHTASELEETDSNWWTHSIAIFFTVVLILLNVGAILLFAGAAAMCVWRVHAHPLCRVSLAMKRCVHAQAPGLMCTPCLYPRTPFPPAHSSHSAQCVTNVYTDTPAQVWQMRQLLRSLNFGGRKRHHHPRAIHLLEAAAAADTTPRVIGGIEMARRPSHVVAVVNPLTDVEV